MRDVSRSPQRVSRRNASGVRNIIAGPRPAFAFAFALFVALARLAGVVRAQATVKANAPQYQLVEDGPAYIIYETPSGETGCRLATAAERANLRRGGDAGVGLRQINHLGGKGETATDALSAGLTIILRGTAQLEANPTAKQAFIAAAAKWEAIISSPITVTIDVDYGPDFYGTPYSSANTLGATSSGGYRVSYTSARQRLINRAPAGSPEAVLLNSLPASSLPTDIGNVNDVFVPPSVARALGYSIDEATAPVPRIGFNSNFAFDFDFSNGVTFNQTDFDSVAVHEIGHALGFNSQVGARELPDADLTRPLIATIWDFYRFRPSVGTPASFSAAQRILTSGTTLTDPHVHFSGGAEIALSTGKPDGTGGDSQQASHWKDDVQGVPHIGIMDPTIRRGAHHDISANDLKAIDFFGYSVGAVTLPPAPANDNFANAQQLGGPAGYVSGTNSGATKEAGEPSHSPDNNAGGKSVWYKWTAPSSGAATFATGTSTLGAASTFDTVLAVYTGSGVGALTSLGKNDDSGATGIVTSIVQFNAVGGTTYVIAVDGWNADEGAVGLNWSHTGTATNPIDNNSFFVRQQYLDFLSREPEAGEPWTNILNNCANPFNSDPASPSAGCDRNIVSSSFFRSAEFEIKGRYVFNFYALSFNRLPLYDEIIPDMASVTGQTPQEVFQKKAAFTANWVTRPEFQTAYGALPNQGFVDTLMNRYSLAAVTTPDPAAPDAAARITLTRADLVNRLGASSMTRAQVVRAIADSNEVSAAEFRRAFVAMQYYGYLRRTPETTGYNAWLNYLNANPADFRTMVDGFMNSVEYRLRFGGR